MAGRPAKEFDRSQFEKLCGLQCTMEEIAGWFNTTKDTLNNWCKRTFAEDFSTVYKKHADKGKIALRRYQMHLAETNASMAIFLGKQYLGQRDMPVMEDETEKQTLTKLADSLNRLVEHGD